MNGIIFKTEQEAIDLITKIDTLVSFLFKGITSTYTHYIKHPIDKQWAVIINLDDMLMLMSEYPYIIKNIGEKFVTQLNGLDESWTPKIIE
jgi:hypothetical protein